MEGLFPLTVIEKLALSPSPRASPDRSFADTRVNTYVRVGHFSPVKCYRSRALDNGNRHNTRTHVFDSVLPTVHSKAKVAQAIQGQRHTISKHVAVICG